MMAWTRVSNMHWRSFVHKHMHGFVRHRGCATSARAGAPLIDPEETVDFLNSGRSRTTARIVDQAPEPTLWDRWIVQP